MKKIGLVLLLVSLITLAEETEEKKVAPVNPTDAIIEASLGAIKDGKAKLIDAKWITGSGDSTIEVYMVTQRAIPRGRSRFSIAKTEDGSWALVGYTALPKMEVEKAFAVAKEELAKTIPANAILEKTWAVQDRNSNFRFNVKGSHPTMPKDYVVTVDKETGEAHLLPQ